MDRSRFTALGDFGREELDRLENSRVAVVGLGATGSVMAEHLARHGVKLVLIDRDYLEPSDLYSSSLYTRDQVDRTLPKAEAAADALGDLTEVESRTVHLGRENLSLLEDVDLVMDGTDNLETRRLIDAWSNGSGIPWIYTAAAGDSGRSMLFDSRCFCCTVPAGASPESCETAGVMREAATISASISSRKAVRYLTGKEVKETMETVAGDSFEVSSPGCRVCEGGGVEALESHGNVSTVCGENKYQVSFEASEQLFERLESLEDVQASNRYLVRLERSGGSMVLFRSGRAIVEAENEGHARQRLSELGV